MVERLRLFRGATELNYGKANLIKSNDFVVDAAVFDIEAESTVTIGSVIDATKADGSTNVFSAKVQEIKTPALWEIQSYTNGYELIGLRVDNVYLSSSPEAIVSEVVGRTQSLTFVSTASSGITLDKYIAQGYAIDIIKDMMDVLNWQLLIDELGNTKFEPKTFTDNGVVFTNGSDFQITEWKEDKNSMFNVVRVIGGFESFQKTETITGTGVTFTLTEKPQGVLSAQTAGPEIDPSLYTVNADVPEVVFDNTITDPEFNYEFLRPVVVIDQDDDSLNEFEEIFEEVQAPWLNTTPDARQYARQLLDAFSTPLIRAKGIRPFLDWNRDPGEIISVVDGLRSRTESMVTSKITFRAESNDTLIEFGDREYLLYDWQRNVGDRVKKLERRFSNFSELNIARLLKHKMKVTLTPTITWQQNSPLDTHIFQHVTLGRYRPDLNMESDCSDNGNFGTWSGTGIAGGQFTTAGPRLSAGEFNGSDRIITVSDDSSIDLTGDFSIVFSIMVTSLPGTLTYVMNKWDGTDGYAIRIAADNKLEMIYSNSGSDSTIKSDTALTANVYQHVAFVKNGTDLEVYIQGVTDNTESGIATAGPNANDFIVGKESANFFTGFIDELRLYDNNLSAANVLNLFNKILVDTDLKCYLSMDNPKFGDRSTTRVTI